MLAEPLIFLFKPDKLCKLIGSP
ncbi:hypothetical protein EMEDMD4_760003 [Sinorhizobium medicae]|uniref:Uncharacterized protein n=1 Tax=Sinorhizobium medicae TaxID=110321 RepID=A0A508X529_9HYPH|nr:hypothetical protein EMEDMD4_760003 [Sinorhizobium medicae]